MKTRALILFLAMAIMFGLGGVTAYVAYQKPPEIIERVEYITLDPEIRYIVKPVTMLEPYPVEIIKEVEVIREVPVSLKDFDNYAELTGLVYEWKDEGWVIPLTGTSGKFGEGQCYAKAMSLRNYAAEKGFNIEIISLDAHLYNDKMNGQIKEGHTICQAKVGWDIWFIEPANLEMQRAYIIP